MKKDCLDIGTIQAFLDGELASDLMDNVLTHIDSCDACALQVAAAEEESAFVFSALEQEFNTLVPTQRLWAKINDSIEKERKPFWQTILAYLKNPAIASFASLLIVFGIFMAYLNSQADKSQNTIAEVTEKTPQIVTPIYTSDSNVSNDSNSTELNRDETKISSKETTKTPFRVVKTDFRENTRRTENKPNRNETINNRNSQPVVDRYLPGEESYIKTIATLEKNVNGMKDEILNPSARFTYEQNLAVVNDAILKMRAEVKKNPNNESAKQVLMSSYQNKVDLLNSVTEKNQLIASMR